MTKDRILLAALDCAREKIYKLMTRVQVSEYAQVTPSLISHHWGTMEDLRDAVIELAVEKEDHLVIAQGMIFKHPSALTASRKLRRQAAKTLQTEGTVTDV